LLCLLGIANLAIWFPLIHFYGVDSGTKQLFWRSFFCQQSRETVRTTLRWSVQRQQAWKTIQIRDFYALTSGLPNTLAATIKSLWETWTSLPLTQQFLVVVPALVFYGYVYILPLARRIRGLQIPVRIRNWCRR